MFEYEWTSGSLMFLAVSCGFTPSVGEYLPIFVHGKIFGGVVPSDWTREDSFGVFCLGLFALTRQLRVKISPGVR